MEYLSLKNKYKIDEDSLIKYGFKKESFGYSFTKKTIENFAFIVHILKEERIDIEVIDEDLEPYIPFKVIHAKGAFVSQLRENANDLVEDIIQNCLISVDMRSKVLEYVYEKYRTIPQYHWKDYPKHATLKNSKNRWYGLLVNIPSKSLGLNTNEKIDILNVKLDPQKILELLDYKTYFPAYHMNKKYWLTVILNEYANLNDVYDLLDESYNLIGDKGDV